MIKAITFDLDGVYFNENSFRLFKEKLPKKVNEETEVNNVLFKSREMLEFKKGNLDEDEYWRYAKLKLGINLNISEIRDLMTDCYQTNDEVVEVVKQVREMGLKACICTNNFPTRIEAINKKYDLFGNFDVAILSYEIGSIKPEPRIFQELIEEAGVLPEEIAYADDKQENVDAAKALGINAFLYEGFDKFLAKLKKFGVELE